MLMNKSQRLYKMQWMLDNAYGYEGLNQKWTKPWLYFKNAYENQYDACIICIKMTTKVQIKWSSCHDLDDFNKCTWILNKWSLYH